MKLFNNLILLLVVGFTVYSCKPDTAIPNTESGINLVSDYNNDVIYEWNELWLIIDKDAKGYRPGPGPKAQAYIGLAAYETAIPGMPSFKSMKGQWGSELRIPEFPNHDKIHWAAAINASYYFMYKNFFKNTTFVEGNGHLTHAEAQRLIDNKYARFEAEFKNEVSNTEYTNSIAWGQSVARAVWDWYTTTEPIAFEADLNPLSNDPSKPYYYDWKAKSIDPATNKAYPGKWYPTNDNPDGGMFPLWGRTRAFASSETQKLCKPPIPYSEDPKSAYYAQVLEAYTRCNAAMPYEDVWVSEFWSDDIFGQTFSPPSRILAIFDQILNKEKANLEKAVEGAVKLGLALNDFAVCCWHSKYVYNIERPENFIQRLIDPNWEPILVNTVNGVRGVTPAFPAYPSGHSTFGGGGGVILADLFGQNYAFTDNCHNDRSEFIGKARTFGSFEDAGYENAFSRVTLGVHFRMDCEAGVQLGQATARRVLALPWKK